MIIMSTELESINHNLKVIISLLLRVKGQDERTMREQILILDQLGLKPSEIGEVLGRSNSYVSKELTVTKKKGMRRHGEGEK